MNDYRGRVLQDGQPVASCSAPTREAMLRELGHYAAVYGQDGPVVMQTRTGTSRWVIYRGEQARQRETSSAVVGQRDALADLMADGCPSISEAARRMSLTQSRTDQHWQAIKRDLGVEQCA